MEVSLQYFMRPGNSWNVSPFLSYTLNDHNFVDFQTEDSDFSGNPLTGVPKHRIYGGLQINSEIRLVLEYQLSIRGCHPPNG